MAKPGGTGTKNSRTSMLGMVPAKIACPSTSYSGMCQKR